MIFFLAQGVLPSIVLVGLYWIAWRYEVPLRSVLGPILILGVLSSVDVLLTSINHNNTKYDVSMAFGSFPMALPIHYIDDETTITSYEAVKAKLIQQQQQQQEEEGGSNNAWALVTGCTSGIGRSITVELARRNINVILVGRNEDAMLTLSKDLEASYGIQVHTIAADLARPSEAQTIYSKVTMELPNVSHLTYLILAAGYGPTSPLHTDLVVNHPTNALAKVEQAIRINVESTASLATLFGHDMVHHQQQKQQQQQLTSSQYWDDEYDYPRIMIISSIVGLGPGVPSSALYSATKAFGAQLAQTLALELEPYGISVTALCPGATKTNFAANADMEQAFIWKLPWLMVSSVDKVAQQAVQAMFMGLPLYIPGFINQITMQLIVPLSPSRLMMKFFHIFWAPWPFSFPAMFASSPSTTNSNDQKEL